MTWIAQNFAAPEDVRILTYPDIPDYRLENALLGETTRQHSVDTFFMLDFYSTGTQIHVFFGQIQIKNKDEELLCIVLSDFCWF
jgi:hypothetical protein